eukprot:gene12509-13793_t
MHCYVYHKRRAVPKPCYLLCMFQAAEQGCSAADLSQTFEIDEMWKDEQIKQEFRKIFDDLQTKITTDGEAKLNVPTPADRKFISAAQRFPEQKATIQWINAQGNSDEDETTINDPSIYSDMLDNLHF